MLKSLDPRNFGNFFLIPLNILRIYEVKYDENYSIAIYYEELKKIVVSSLKKKGYDNGQEELLQDEVFSPTFEELLILWCLDRVQPNLSNKIKPVFDDKLNSGISLHQLKDEMFLYFDSEIRETRFNTKSNIKTETCENSFEEDINRCDNFVVVNETPIKEEADIETPEEMQEDMCETIIQEDFGDNLTNDEDQTVTDLTNEVWIKQDDYSQEDSISSPENEEDDLKNNKLDEHNPNEITTQITEIENFNCSLCNQNFSTAEILYEHQKMSHFRRKFFGRKFGEEKEPEEFKCTHCDEKFPSAKERALHKKALHPIIKGKLTEICPHCGKEIRCYALKQHLLTHTHSEYRCKLCALCFESQERLDGHLERLGPNHKRIRTTKKKTVKCDKCKRSFVSVEEYGVHICKHFVCDICQEAFLFRINLDKHKKYHDGEKIFPCDQCESIFFSRKALHQHDRKIHDESAKKYKCEICTDKAYVDMSDLQHHISINHSNERNYKCDVCEKAFKAMKFLKRHYLTSHSDYTPPLVSCTSCDVKFINTQMMKKHIESGKCSLSKGNLEPPKVEVE